MTLSSAPAGLADEWQVLAFAPRRPRETVGALTAQHGLFTFHGSANLDIPETIAEFWKQAEAARVDHERAQAQAKIAEAMKP